MVDKSGAAPNESGEDLRSRAYSMFQGGKRIPKNSFWLGYLPSALFVDGLVTWWFPGAGAIYIGVCRGLYW
ncbi:MAG: hypothetical protein Q7R74_02010, partial [bacterium]|nr:hypothetical protein [bacterium]